MKRNEEFILKEMAGNIILVPYGNKAIDFNGIVTLNETAKFLWDNTENEFDENSLVKAILGEYDVDEETARKSVIGFIESLKEVGAIE